MAPQDDLTAERAAATLLGRMGLVGHPADAQFIGDILEFRRQTRQEALREAAKHIRDKRKCWEHDGVQKILSGIADELDRLASEGG
jgi:hypothetical protein